MHQHDLSFEDVTMVVFHKGCSDGFACAWAFHYFARKFTDDKKQIFYLPLNYEDPIKYDLFKDKTVVVCDFSFKPLIFNEIKKCSRKVLLIDHHETAKLDLKDEKDFIYDVNECGATLTWKWLQSQFPNDDIQMPEIIKYVRDRDLWKNELPETKEINAYLFHVIGFDFGTWDEFFYEKNEMDEKQNLSICSMYGLPIVIAFEKMINIYATISVQKVFYGIPTRVVNVGSLSPRSEISAMILKKFPETKIAMTWFYNHQTTSYKISLRSRPKETNVGQLAKLHGGGGHDEASGFEIYFTKINSIETLFSQ